MPNPTSQQYTFNGVLFFTLFAKNQTELYWGARYKINSKLEIQHSNGEVIEVINTNVGGCLRKNDAHFDSNIYSDCTPADVPCWEE